MASYYIEPQGQVYLYADVPLSPKQTDTLYFDSDNDFFTYLLPKRTWVGANYTYIRERQGVIRVECTGEECVYSNYMSFIHISGATDAGETYFTKHRFYAFITKCTYINNNCYELEFEIDPLQTWMHDFKLNSSFCERYTVTKDDFEAHTEAEDVYLGEPIYNLDNDGDPVKRLGFSAISSEIASHDFANNIIMVLDDPDGQVTGIDSTIGGIFTPFKYLCYGDNAAGRSELLLKIYELTQNGYQDKIINIYMTPAWLTGFKSGGSVYNASAPARIDVTAQALDPDRDTLDGYRPHNKKLYTYPYNFYRVTSPDGVTQDFQYERFNNPENNLRPRFFIRGNVAAPVSIALCPYGYNGMVGNDYLNNEAYFDKMSIANFPQCPWANDAYAAWLAQNSVPMVLNTVGQGITTAGTMGAYGGEAGAVAGLATGLISGAIQSAVAMRQASYNDPHTYHGSTMTGNLNFSTGNQFFFGGRMSVAYNQAVVIDRFFTMYGYKVNRWITPKLKARERFTYIQTRGANITGKIPAEDIAYISNCFDRGLRLWCDHETMFNYSGTNEPLGDGGLE